MCFYEQSVISLLSKVNRTISKLQTITLQTNLINVYHHYACQWDIQQHSISLYRSILFVRVFQNAPLLHACHSRHSRLFRTSQSCPRPPIISPSQRFIRHSQFQFSIHWYTQNMVPPFFFVHCTVNSVVEYVSKTYYKTLLEGIKCTPYTIFLTHYIFLLEFRITFN